MYKKGLLFSQGLTHLYDSLAQSSSVVACMELAMGLEPATG